MLTCNSSPEAKVEEDKGCSSSRDFGARDAFYFKGSLVAA